MIQFCTFLCVYLYTPSWSFMGLDEHLGDEHALQGTSSGMIANDAWAFQGEGPVKSWKAWDSTRIHEILIPWCIKMYQDVPRCWWRLIYLKTIEHYLYQYLYEWNGHWNSKKSCDVFCHIHELNCTVLLGNLVACFPELSFPYLMTILTSLLGCFENWATCQELSFWMLFRFIVWINETASIVHYHLYNIIWLS